MISQAAGAGENPLISSESNAPGFSQHRIHFRSDGRPLRVCLVTEELSGVGKSGGIGAAFHELAVALAAFGCVTDILHVPTAALDSEQFRLTCARYAALGIKYDRLREDEYVATAATPQARSYAIFRYLQKTSTTYDVLHFHDYKGLGFYTQLARSQGLSFLGTSIVVQLHGPTRWTLQANEAFFQHLDQLRIDYMERESLRLADDVVSPSQYLLRWLEDHGFDLPAERHRHVIKNVFGGLIRGSSRHGTSRSVAPARPVRHLVYFGRHERRKGLTIFLDAVDRVADQLRSQGGTVTFLGGFGHLDGVPSGLILAERTKNWGLPLRIMPSLNRDQAAAWLAGREETLVVVPSPHENSPYTVLEALALGLPVLSSSSGGAPELYAEEVRPILTCQMTGRSLANRLSHFIEHGAPAPQLAESAADVEKKWFRFHENVAWHRPVSPAPSGFPNRTPKVVVGITHYERPKKILDAVLSIIAQTYDNIEIVVVDDGSSKPDTVAVLSQVESLLARVGGRLIRQENGYLGAARNTVLRNTTSDYVLFLDDDDVALPTMVETLVKAAITSKAPATTCLNRYMPESIRASCIADPQTGDPRPSYLPTGGPLSLACYENVFGSAVALLERSAIDEVGGYTELVDVGFEDYELFIRLAIAGKKIVVCPETLFLYETGRPSMANRTSLQENFLRCYRALTTSGTDRTFMDDVLNYSMGTNVQWAVHGNVRWRFEMSEHAALLKRALDAGDSETELLLANAEYAAAIGNIAAEMAYRTALRTQASDFQAHVDLGRNAFSMIVPGVVKLQSPNGAPLGNDAERFLDDARISHALRRPHETWAALQSAFKVVDRADEVTIRRLFEFAAAAFKSGSKEILELASDSAEQEEWRLAAPSLEAATFFVDLGLATGDSALAKHGLVICLLVDEVSYLSQYPDVSTGVATGLQRSGYDHFRQFGVVEGRVGYLGFVKLLEKAQGGVLPDLSHEDLPAAALHHARVLAGLGTSTVPGRASMRIQAVSQ